MTVLHAKTITKKAKNGDKIVTPNPPFLLPKFAGLHIAQLSTAGGYMVLF